MKKLLLSLVCALVLGTGAAMAQAEQGDIAAGLQLNYGSFNKNLGLGARFMYNPINHLRVGVEVDYFFKKDYVSMVDVSLNGQYMFGLLGNRLFLYPTIGVCYASATMSWADLAKDLAKAVGEVYTGGYSNESVGKFGMNLGAGAQWQFTDHIGVSLEYRHTIMKSIDQGVFSAGVLYKF